MERPTTVVVVNNIGRLFDKIVVFSRPIDTKTQEPEETNQAIIDLLNEAIESGVIDNDKLTEILGFVTEYIELIREHLGTTKEKLEKRNLWRFHHGFLLKLKVIMR